MVDLNELFHQVVRYEIELWKAVEARLDAELHLPLTHYEPMAVMARVEGCRVHDVASDLVITTGGASKLVDRIEEHGWCRRRPNPDDRRSSVLELTPSGRRLVARAHAVIDDELQRRIGGAASEGALDRFLATLTRLRSAGQRTA